MQEKALNDSGVIYQLSGPACAELLAVSVHSLRKFYCGPIAIFATPDCRDVAKRIAEAARPCAVLGCSLMDASHGFLYEHWAIKPITWISSPFNRTLYLDCDTVVVNPITDILQVPGFIATQVADFTIQGQARCAKSLRFGLRQLDLSVVSRVRMRAAAASNYPYINAGVAAFDKGSRILNVLHDMTLAYGRIRGGTDETMLQVMLCEGWDIHVWPNTWNCCVGYDKQVAETKILHFHAKGWRRESISLWVPHAMACLEDDFAGCSQWFGHHNWKTLKMVKVHG